MPSSLTRRLIGFPTLTSSRKHCSGAHSRRAMVTLVVATTLDPASIGPASALLAMPGWHPGPFLQVILHLILVICSTVFWLTQLHEIHKQNEPYKITFRTKSACLSISNLNLWF